MNNSANAEIRVGKSPLHAAILYGLANLEENFKTSQFVIADASVDLFRQTLLYYIIGMAKFPKLQYGLTNRASSTKTPHKLGP